MRRYWLHGRSEFEHDILLQGQLFHHVVDVCRQGMGSRFELLTEGGRAFLVEIVKIEGKMAQTRILEERIIPPLEKPYIHLAISVPRFTTFETIIEKSVELGVYQIQPFVSQFSFVRKIDSRLKGKYGRWNKIVASATEQCGRGDLMEIVEPQILAKVLQRLEGQTGVGALFAYEGETTQHARQAMAELCRDKDKMDEVWIFVGSEGGFAHEEVDLFQKAGLSPMTLGRQVLRVETACLALVSILKYELNLMK